MSRLNPVFGPWIASFLILSAGLGAQADPSAGTITGVVEWTGPTPPTKFADATGCDKILAAHWPNGRIPLETVVVDPRGRLANVVVYVSRGLPEKTWPVPTKKAIVNQVKGRFVPHVLAVQVGQPVEFRNSEPTAICYHFKSKYNGSWNFTLSDRGRAPARRPFQRMEVGSARLVCDCHGWMETRVAILDHPYFAVSDAEGRFALSGLPLGAYTLTAWHERFGRLRQRVLVEGGKAPRVRFTFSPEKK